VNQTVRLWKYIPLGSEEQWIRTRYLRRVDNDSKMARKLRFRRGVYTDLKVNLRFLILLKGEMEGAMEPGVVTKLWLWIPIRKGEGPRVVNKRRRSLWCFV